MSAEFEFFSSPFAWPLPEKAVSRSKDSGIADSSSQSKDLFSAYFTFCFVFHFTFPFSSPFSFDLCSLGFPSPTQGRKPVILSCWGLDVHFLTFNTESVNKFPYVRNPRTNGRQSRCDCFRRRTKLNMFVYVPLSFQSYIVKKTTCVFQPCEIFLFGLCAPLLVQSIFTSQWISSYCPIDIRLLSLALKSLLHMTFLQIVGNNRAVRCTGTV